MKTQAVTRRGAGVFLHPTSLPSPFGIGDLGDDAVRWLTLLNKYDHTYWQLCPLTPTGYGDSPYQSFSSFAGNPLLISPARLRDEGLLTQSELEEYPRLSPERVDYGSVIEAKDRLFRKAFSRFEDSSAFRAFCKRERYWLDDYALFRVLKDLHGGRPWPEWDDEFKVRRQTALRRVSKAQADNIRYHKFLQYVFDAQWEAIRVHAEARGICIIGDIPCYVSFDSADTWASPALFELDSQCRPLRVAGVPPDYFSKDGQLWGSPLYRWDVMETDGYAWWIARLKKTLERLDLVRLDHFRGFASYWAVPAHSPTAVNGEWMKGPGIKFFEAMERALGSLPLIAEDLGFITDDVVALREAAGLPGMKVLQFAFDGNPDNPYLPYNITADSVIYTGTHDNDTTVAWFTDAPQYDKLQVCEYLDCQGAGFWGPFLRMAYAAPSRLSIIPLQDVLALGSGHRLNTPGTSEGNWQWRFHWNMIREDHFAMLQHFAAVYGRRPKPTAGGPASAEAEKREA
jgi:4-alpha-glucanotransferase